MSVIEYDTRCQCKIKILDYRRPMARGSEVPPGQLRPLQGDLFAIILSQLYDKMNGFKSHQEE